MSNINTSFEHVLHNLQSRAVLIANAESLLGKLMDSIHQSCTDHSTYATIHNAVSTRILATHAKYMDSMERFDIGIVTLSADYYAIIDRHIDQFNFKYIHNYASHKEHYNPVIVDYNPGKRVNVLDLINIFVRYCYNFKRFKVYSDIARACRTHEKTWNIYQNLSKFISTENIHELADLFMYELDVIINAIKTIASKDVPSNKLKLSSSDHAIINEIKTTIQQFNNIKLDFRQMEDMPDYCECGNAMQVMPESSELVCENCGYLYELKGTVFNDSQFYSQESIRYKHAGYEPSKHVRSWLERIQARETNTITEKQLEKINACIKRDGITNKKRLTIEQLRRYLKASGLTELNEHVALIRRLITGVVPPQLTYSETQDITNSFAKAVKAYNIIRPSNKSNMLFYPYIVWKLVEMHVPDYYKRKNLLSFIHLQGTQTLIQNDTIWSQICKITRGFSYKPTDRYAYFD